MTSSQKIQINSKVNKPMPEEKVMEQNSFRKLLNKRMTKKVPFMDDKVEIQKLKVSEVMEIQESAKAKEDGKEVDSQSGFDAMRQVIQLACPDASDMTSEEFNAFPLDELVKLSKHIMAYSGIGDDAK